MVENYKHLYEQTKKMLAMYQDELVPGFRKTIEELEAKSKWVSVKDRLPKQSGKYLVCTKNRNVYQTKFYSYPEEKGGHWGQKDKGRSITHWMPLPEPPKPCEE